MFKEEVMKKKNRDAFMLKVIFDYELRKWYEQVLILINMMIIKMRIRTRLNASWCLIILFSIHFFMVIQSVAKQITAHFRIKKF